MNIKKYLPQVQSITRDWGLEFLVNRGGYFNQDYTISFTFIYGRVTILLPFKTRLSEGCDMPRYGFLVSHNSLMIYHFGGQYDSSIGQMCGTNCKVWDIPFVSYKFIGHWLQMEDESMHKVGKGEFASDIRDSAKHYVVPFSYEQQGETVFRVADITVERRAWHRKWFPFRPLVHNTIDVSFSDEIGERTGSYKGGVTGCGYDMKKNEHPIDCFYRMLEEKKF